MGPQRRSGHVPEEINILRLPGIERRSPGHHLLAGQYTRDVQSDGSHVL